MDVEPARRRHRRHLDPGAGARLGRLAGDPDSSAAQRRFRVAAQEIAALASGTDAAVLEQLATAPLRAMGRVVDSSNAVYLLELDAPDPHATDQPMRAIYKPARGERPLHDFARHTLHLRERAAYLLSAAARMEVVPPTGLRDGPLGPGSVQLYIHPAEGPLSDTESAGVEAQLHRVAAFDVLANNADRKRAHLLLDAGGHLWGIDNALTFLPYPRQRTVLLGLGGSDLDPEDAELVRRLAGGDSREELRGALRTLLTATEVDAFEGRLEELAAHPWYPRLDEWDGRPFEWW
ncbi:MAG: SCO1664 family protein [Candidatus Dormibacteria bacterium]